MSVDVKYRTSATANGGGRTGITSLDSGSLTVTMATPTEMGGNGKGHNPEELFAMGYAGCFLSALRAAARMQKLGTVPEDATVSAQVGIGARSEGGFGLEVALKVSLPGVEDELAQTMIEAAHAVCPYSNATRGNIDVTLERV
ncbi:organic hydroperoxide resistance protein [Pararhodobacter zhoushanensis]|uniref:Organic hydroperoxide resistance protein n=1 Tax=Pararhodobacter zhoushanensis TaxID=2479545 RepID=A0ABT3GTB0_9RHOB|nr:organic hydroperoxide resistance protein [Pararhodobacter zhoushanensis]MCW1930782.1 organic hydroperoxide resistance protein [Pararhodobacter zhoushanensis]